MGRILLYPLVASLFLLILVAPAPFVPVAMAQANIQGKWQTLPYTMPINPIHVALLRTGKVLVVSGSGNLSTNSNLQAALWDPQTGNINVQTVGWDMFCNGMIVLPDGRPFIVGGTIAYNPTFLGDRHASVYDPATGTFTDLQSMAHGRWYPTATVLGDGRVMVFSGDDETGQTNISVEIYTVGAGWSQELPAPWVPPLYPRMHVLPNGNVFYSGETTNSSIYYPSTNTWTTSIAFTNYSGDRKYGTSVLLPLTPSNGYKPRVMIFGGGDPATATTELIDLSASNPQWVNGPNMSQPRIEMNATILPNGKVLALGGSLNDEDTATASLNADLYDPATNTFSSAGAEVYPRLYHSVSMLMPDGTVWVAGGNPQPGTYEPHMEIYSPSYLFNPDGSLAKRPAITNVSSNVIGYGGSFQVQTPDAVNISSVVLMRDGAVTHSFDMDQRYVGLSYTKVSGVLNITGPPNGNIAPPGYYMLYLVNSSGVPSLASILQVSLAPTDTPPTGTITSPTANVAITAGQSVSYSGTGAYPDGTITAYSWIFPGGNPTSSSLANAGNVTYSTPGTYVSSLTVTDNAGLTDPHPPTRTITVMPAPDFSVSASPSSRAVVAGGSANYAITVTGQAGFTGTVLFSVNGLPVGANATFSPNTVSGTGSSTLLIATTSNTTTGFYTVNVTGTSGTLTHTSSVAFSISQFTPGQGAISVDFVGSNTTAMGISETAGVVAKSSWNNATVASSSSPLVLVDETGTGTTATATWVSDNVWNTNITDQAGNFRMMRGYLDTGSAHPSTVSISGLRAGTYNIYVYVDGDNATASHTGVYQLSGSGITTTSVSLTDAPNTNFNGTFTQANNSSGNYVQFSNISITASGFTVTATPGATSNANPRAPVNGIQIIPAAPPAPDFTLSATPSSQTVNPGGNTSYTVNVGALNGFTGSMALSVSGLPAGASGLFNPTSITGSGSATLNVTTTTSTPIGSPTLTITGTSGSLSHSATVTLVVNTPNFTLSATPSSQTVNPGGNTSYTVNVGALNGFTGSVALSVSGLPAGASGLFNPTTVTGSGSATLNVTTTTSTPIGSPTLTITGTSGSLSHSATVTLAVNTPNFTLSATPSSQTVNPGGNTSYTVNVGALNGFTGSVALSVSGLPAGASGLFNPTTVTGSGSATLNVTTTTSTPIGSPTLTITGTSGSLSHTATVTLSVTTNTQGAISINFVGSNTTAMGISETAGVVAKSSWNNATVASSSSPLVLVDETGTGTTATATWVSDNVWNTNITDQAGNFRMMRGYLDTGSAHPSTVSISGLRAGTYNIYVYVDGDNATASHTGVYQLSGSGITTTSVSLTDAPNTNFNGTFTQANNSSGNYVQFSNISITASGFTVTATPGATSNANPRAPVNGIQIIPAAPPAPDFTLSATPSSQTVNPGGNTSYTVNVGALNGFTGSVALSVSGLPAGASGLFNPTTVTGSGSATLNVTTTTSTPIGSPTLTITGTSGSLSHTATVTLSVTTNTQGAISINFVGSNATAMGISEIAGVVAKSSWNNATVASSSSPLVLVDETGTGTTATATWVSDNVWNTNITDQAGNFRMMRGYLDTGSAHPSTVSISGLRAGTYNIYVYVDGDNATASHTGVYQLSGSGITTTSVSLTDAPNTNFNGTFTQANNSSGNYVQFSNISITASGFTVTATPGATSNANPRAPVNGIQIIPAP